MKEMTDNQAFKDFVADIKQRIKAAQYRALRAVNKEQIALYWSIGEAIVHRQTQYGWGKSVVEELASELQKEFVGVQGFSASNLWRMRNFYLEYNNHEFLAPVVREIGWTHNIIILEKCKDEHQRFFYIEMARSFGWSKSMLINAIDN